jgi:acyl transferase domain-containing protein/acyl carrier protein
MGGTNAHVVVEEAPDAPARSPADTGCWRPLPLSARTGPALAALARNLAAHLKAYPELDLDDVAYTLQSGRRAMEHRRLCLCRDRHEAIACLEAAPLRGMQAIAGEGRRPLVFMFSGQGSQYPGMARALYAREPAFRTALDECAALIADDIDLLSLLSADTDPALLGRTEHAQPVLFAVEYALALLWRSRGIEPDALIGHSIGEYVAACLAGVFTLGDALATVVQRGRLMQACEPGAMLAVLQSAEQMQALLGGGVELAAHNAPDSCVLSGPIAAIEALRQRLDAAGTACRLLETSHGFHSAMMEPALGAFAEFLAGIELHAPSIDMVSNRTGDWLSAAQATAPAYWVEHLRHPVRFADGIRTLRSIDDPLFIEVGPGEALSRFARACLGADEAVVASLPGVEQAAHSEQWLLRAFSSLWLHGVPVDWQTLRTKDARARRKVSLPTYPFARERYAPRPAEPGMSEIAQEPRPLVEHAAAAVEDWFHVPAWDRIARVKPAPADGQCWVVFGEPAEQGLIDAVPGVTIVRAEPAGAWAETDDGGYRLDPRVSRHHRRLFGRLRAQARTALQWVLLPAVADTAGMDALVTMAQALLDLDEPLPLLLSVVTRDMQTVTGEESIDPERATIGGLCQVLPQEVPGLDCRLIDLAGAAAGDARQRQLLIDELSGPYDHRARIVALRGRYRWEMTWRGLPLAAEGPDLLPIEATYAIVGDLTGGLGMHYARFLRRERDARLILVGREGLPPSDDWERWLATHGTLHPVSRFIQRMKGLGREGEHWQLHSIDVGDPAVLGQALLQGTRHLGPLAGVFHADVMGDAASCPLAQLDPDERARIMRVKVKGCRALKAAVSAHQPGFVLMQSSLSALVGGPGFAAYAAANHFLDALAIEHTSPTRWISINWDACQLDDGPPAGGTALMAAALTPEQVWQATRRVLAEPGLAQVAVSPRPLLLRIDAAFDPSRAAAPSVRGLHGRPDLDTDYVAPRTPIEKAVAAAMAELLGIAEVGADDDFFALGGNSLLAIQAVTRLRKAFGVELPMRALLYGTPTVAGIAAVIEEDLAELSEDKAAAVEDLLDRIEDLSPDEAAKQL